MLPPMVMEGLTLGEGLGKLFAAYQDACMKSGETPLPLTFSVPPEANRRLRVHLQPQSFRTSVRLLAALAGMTANRNGLEYRFGPLPSGGKPGKETIEVRPDFNTELGEMTGEKLRPEPFSDDPPIPRKSVAEYIAALGLELDPDTRLSLAASGKLLVETANAADAATIKALAGLISSEPRVQMKVTAKVVELKAGMEWMPPDLSEMSDGQVQLLMRDLSQRAGVDLMTMPSVTAHNGQAATIEMIREFTYPNRDDDDVFETRKVGKIMEIQGGQLGFGQEMNFFYQNTTFEGFDPTNPEQPIFSSEKVSSSGFSSDGGTRLSVQTRPDGSKTLILMTTEQIDATGRPIR
ncbi:MAG: hypothetical protein V4584_12320 [Verrucomicrobiota bacterium]